MPAHWIYSILNYLHIPEDHEGYTFLYTAVYLRIEYPDLELSRIYEDVALRNGVTSMLVINNIRDIIHAGYTDAGKETFASLGLFYEKQVYINADEFICHVALLARLKDETIRGREHK